MIPTREAVAGLLPLYRGSLDVYTLDQDTPDIIQAILVTHEQEKKNYDKIADLFDGETAEDIAANCFDFLKDNFRYHAEDEDLQTTRTPAAIVATGQAKGIDCKNYSLFTGGIIAALDRKYYSIPWCYRFAAYSKGGLPNRYLRHVFVVMYPGDPEEIWIDPVLGFLNSREKVPCYKKDVNAMLGKLSGIGRGNRIGDNGDDYYYEDPFVQYDPSNLGDGSGSGAGTFDISQGYSKSAGSDVSPADSFNPDTQQALTPSQISYGVQDAPGGGYSFDYGDLSGGNTYYGSGAADAGSGNFIDNLVKSFTGGASKSSGGGSGISLGSGKSSSTGQPSQQKTSGQTPINIYNQVPPTGSSGSTSTTTWLIVGAVVVGGLILFMVNRKK